MHDHKQTVLDFDLADLRDRSGLTYAKISEITGVSRTTLHNLQKGGPVKSATVHKIVRAMRDNAECRPVHAELDRFIGAILAMGKQTSTSIPAAQFNKVAKDVMASQSYLSEREYLDMIEMCRALLKHLEHKIQKRRDMNADFFE